MGQERSTTFRHPTDSHKREQKKGSSREEGGGVVAFNQKKTLFSFRGYFYWDRFNGDLNLFWFAHVKSPKRER